MANETLFRAVDDSFGPFFDPYQGAFFDFTLLFEETILSIAPSVLLLLAVPLRILWLLRQSRKVKLGPLRSTKIVLLSLLFTLNIANLVIWTTPLAPRTRASIAAASVSLVTAAALGVLSYLEHGRSIRPSSIINTFMLLTVPMDAAHVRTLWLRGNSAAAAAIFSAVGAVKLVILVLEAVEKRGILLPEYLHLSPEDTSGLYGRGVFWWLNPMFMLGYRGVIKDEDLYSTDGDLSSTVVNQRFQRQWAKYRNSRKKHALIIAMVRTMAIPLASAILPRVLLTFFNYMQPFFIRRVINFVGEPITNESTNHGWGLTAAYGLVYVGIAISGAAYYHKAYRMVTMVRGALVSAIYIKTVDLSTTAIDESSAVTLMDSDVHRICEALAFIHETWACLIEIGLGIWLLYQEIGLAMLGPLILTMSVVSSTLALSDRTAKAQKGWMSGIQTRVGVTSKILESMKGVKMLGISAKMGEVIRDLRSEEIGLSIRLRRIMAATVVFGNTSDVYAPGVAFTIFVIMARYNGQTLNVGSAFTALSLIGLLTSPIATLIFSLPRLMAAIGCFDRIQVFITSPGRQDHRILIGQSDDHNIANQSTSQASTSTGQQIELQDMKPARREASPVATSIQVKNATFGWSETDEPVVKDVSFDVVSGKLTMIIGPVGCGKSSLLKGLLGEIPSSKGFIYMDSLGAAFVDQSCWIQRKTLRDNILGSSIFEERWYVTVVHACALDQDIKTLPNGDLTLVGSSGTSLSGGQKLRLALARAVYSRRTLLILDDSFSGLDATSEDRIFSRLLGEQGLLRKLGVTVVLVTHAAHRLSYADHIVSLEKGGSISEQGTFDELMKSGGYVSLLTARHKSENGGGASEESTESTDPKAINPEISAESLDPPVGDLAVYNYYFDACGWTNMGIFFVLMASFAFFILFPDLWIKFWTQAVAAQGNSVNGKYLGALIALETAGMISLIWVVFHSYLILVPRTGRILHERLLKVVMHAPLSFFTSTDTGQTINRFSQDMTLIDVELPAALIEFTASICIGTMRAIMICLSAAYFAAVLPFVLVVMYFLQKFYLRTSRQIRLMDLEAKSPLYSNFIETLNGLVTIRAFGWAKNFEEHSLVLLDASQRPFYLLYCIQRWLGLVLDLVVAGLAVILMVLMVKLRGQLDPGLVGVALLNVMSFNISLTRMIKFWTSLETSMGAISRLKSFTTMTISEDLPNEIEPVHEKWPMHGRIEYVNVSAAYTTLGNDVLRDLNLVIPAGQKIGVCGKSGSGKSSLITSLFRMLEITEGTLTIDGVDLSTVSRQTIRERLNAIPQDPIFIKGTIRANLDPLFRSSDLAIEDALKRVGLWNIINIAGGLDISREPETLLSQGQRQIFCLARAILNPSQIVILDEVTASVDMHTDELMQRIIREEFKGRTIIAVAHRLQTILDFDRIVVLDKGRLVECGKPQELLDRAGGSMFRDLWDA